MAAVNGFKSSIRTGSTFISLMDGWNLNITMNNPEYMSFGSTFASCVSAVKRWTAGCKGTLDRASTGQSALIDQLEGGGTVADVPLRFYPSTSTSIFWYGNGRIDSCGIDSQVDGLATVNFAFKGNGAINYTTSGT